MQMALIAHIVSKAKSSHIMIGRKSVNPLKRKSFNPLHYWLHEVVRGNVHGASGSAKTARIELSFPFADEHHTCYSPLSRPTSLLEDSAR
jgi:hypothetical protein